MAGIDREEARKRLLAVTGNDWPLAQRLLPFTGLLRADLRGLPVVILPGALYVTESALRRNTGTHYTPRNLAEEVVEHALEPFVYAPGPLQTADRNQWQPINSAQVLALKVADIAMGSAAFLVPPRVTSATNSSTPGCAKATTGSATMNAAPTNTLPMPTATQCSSRPPWIMTGR